MSPPRHQPSQKTNAFTLVEMLIVVSIIAIILAALLPPIVNSLAANRLTAAGNQLQSLLSQAQQIASSEGRPVEVRFYKYQPTNTPGNTEAYRSIVLMRHYDSGEPSPFTDEAGTILTNPISVHHGEFLHLPEGVAIASSPSASSILTLPQADTQQENHSYNLNSNSRTPYEFPAENPEYRSFIFRSSSTNLPANPSDRWFVTLVADNDEERKTPITSVPNYYCVQIDPINGRITTYRP